MGIKGLYSCLKPFSIPVIPSKESPKKIGLDAYAFLYKYREDIDTCIGLFDSLQKMGHTLFMYVDGTPPKEKLGELQLRKSYKEHAYQQAKALRSFLNDEKSSELTEESRLLIEKQIKSCEHESWRIRSSLRTEFLEKVKNIDITIIQCEGEADVDLIESSKREFIDIVIANDMDLFVGGVERLWILGKVLNDPLFMEFHRSSITKELGIHPKSWVDVAILSGYEKCPGLKRCSANQAIIWIRYYGCVENLFQRKSELLQGTNLLEFQRARELF